MPRKKTRGFARTTSVTAVILVAVSAAGGLGLAARSSDHSPRTTASVSSVSAAAATPVPATTSAEPAVDLDGALASAVEPLLTDAGEARVSVAVLDTGNGAGAVYGDGVYDTASIVKVDILAALLLMAQDENRVLTAEERNYATAMIERSDNASATALLQAIGGAEALDAANERLGLTATTATHAWGLTQTTAADQLALLEAVFGTESELSEKSRTYLQELMGQVEADQQWGVSAAGSTWALKNGWLPRTSTGLWDINSIGQVRADGHTYLVAVLSDGQRTQEAGITLVESVAKAAVEVLDDAR
ncbi:serine hydrolase [Streptomyces sp. NPDC052052]|uniref:serine hydrolase n=1 Tax=Streptomyces sp. NPDC052052 TaxID=3154756 RepID=UPI003440B276